LIVDDEPTVLMSMRETLRHEGYVMVAAAGPREALTLAREQEFAVVLSDQQMPGMTGIELLTKIKELRPETVRILVSALPTAELALEAINQAEIFRFITKPWQRGELVETVRGAVTRFKDLAQERLRAGNLKALNQTLTRLTQTLQKQLDEERARKR
jgi:response regulator RpfG family c-di-GMP phosphodiesterase